jgi:hypothetical protein
VKNVAKVKNGDRVEILLKGTVTFSTPGCYVIDVDGGRQLTVVEGVDNFWKLVKEPTNGIT